MRKALEEILALGHLAYTMGNYKKMEGIVTAVRYISEALGGLPKPLEERLRCLEDLINQSDNIDWVI